MGKKAKKIIINVVVSIIGFYIFLCFLSWAMNKAVEDTTTAVNNYVETIVSTEPPKGEDEIKKLAEFSNAKAFLLSDNSIGVVQFNYKNISDEITSFGSNYKIKAYQNGIELEKPYFVNDEKYTNYDNMSKNIKQDISIPIEQAFKLENSTDDIEIDIYYSPNVYPSNDTLVQNILIPISQDENT